MRTVRTPQFARMCTPVEEVRITEGRVTPMQLAVVPNQIELLRLLKANYGFHDSA
jgi:hypothetical protein